MVDKDGAKGETAGIKPFLSFIVATLETPYKKSYFIFLAFKTILLIVSLALYSTFLITTIYSI